jgi:FkbM family methyltransferase
LYNGGSRRCACGIDLGERDRVLNLNLGKQLFRVAVAKVDVPGIREPVGLRLESTDPPTFIQVFVHQEYDFELPLAPRFIIDAGGNVGYTAIWFANRFPAAKIVVIESDSGNFKLLRENTAPYGNVELVQAGVWPRSGHLKVVTHDASGRFLGEWGYQVEETMEAGEGTIRAVTLGEVLQGSGEAAIDILKLDVEGAEKEIMSAGVEAWLPRTNVLMVELHDRFKPGCSQAFFAAVKPHEFHQAQRGQTLVFIRKKLVL